MSKSSNWLENMRGAIEYVFAFSLVIECASIYFLVLPKIVTIALILFPPCSLIILNLVINERSSINYLKAGVFLLWFCFLIFVLYESAYNKTSAIYKFGVIFLTYVVYYLTIPRIKYRLSVFYKIADIVVVIAAMSLMLWLPISFLGVLPMNMSVVVEWGYSRTVSGFYWLYFQPQTLDDFFGLAFLNRNSGIFAEAPMYSFILVFGLLVELYLKKSISWLRVTILVVTILTTFSTSGYLLLLLVAAAKMVFLKARTKIIWLLKAMIIPFGVICVAYIGYFFLSEKASSHSASVRQSVIENELSSWKKSPIIGNGYNFVEEGSSNSLFLLLSEGGILLISLYIIAFIFIPFGIYVKTKDSTPFVFCLLLFVIFCFTAVNYRIIILSLLAFWYSYALTNKGVKT